MRLGMNCLSFWKTAGKISAFTLITLFSACNRHAYQENPVTGRSKTMILHLQDDPIGLNPHNTVGAVPTSLHNLLFDHLIALDPKTLDLVPQLAAAMPTISEDKLSYTFRLRPNLTFADSKPVTVEDVVFSFKALMNPYISSAPRRAELHNFENCYALGTDSIVFTLLASGPFNLNRLAINFFVIPKHIYDPLNLSDGYSALDARNAERQGAAFQDSSKLAMLAFADFFEDEKISTRKRICDRLGTLQF